MTPTDKLFRCGELRHVALVQPGYLSRARVQPTPNGTHLLLQARDVSPKSGLLLNAAVRFMPKRNADLYRVSRGDILLTARGQDHHALLIDSDLDDVLASSVFYIIRPCKDVVPGYLAWWLNQPDTQANLESISSGTGIGYIARPLLEHIPIAVPPFDAQLRIAEVMKLWQQQRLLQGQLDQKRKQFIHAVCRQAVQQERIIL